MQKDVLFFTHTNKENGADDSVSKYNNFEVSWLKLYGFDSCRFLLHLGRDDT